LPAVPATGSDLGRFVHGVPVCRLMSHTARDNAVTKSRYRGA
jgi:hypothetical protein